MLLLRPDEAPFALEPDAGFRAVFRGVPLEADAAFAPLFGADFLEAAPDPVFAVFFLLVLAFVFDVIPDFSK